MQTSPADLHHLSRFLSQLVEGGPALWRSFAGLGLVDEVVLFMANATCSGSDPVKIEPDGEIGLEWESHQALAALAAHRGDLPLHLVERRNLGPDTLWRMIVRRADYGSH